jgi:3-hydroxymyristoyl/3-hydroxydecanoyl-(acyl carrier protein) dehydratase
MLDISTASIQQREVVLPDNSPYFDGHFEHKKILPAVAQVSLCMAQFKEVLQPGFTLSSARFYREIGPGKLLAIRCDNSKKTRLVFELLDQTELCSKIVFSLAQQE